MTFMGDFHLGDTIDLKFTSRRFSSGAPYTLAGSPAVAAYPDNSTTEITAGITLSVDFDTRTGLNNVRIVATSGNGYAAGTSYALVITAGTVDSVSVVGEVVGLFTLDRSAAYARLGAPAGASIAADIAGVQSDTDNIQTRLPTSLVSGRMDASVGAMAADVITAAATAADFSTEVNAAVLAVLGALNVAASAGDPGTTTTVVAYLKQLVNTLEGTAGIVTFPSAAAPANAVSLAEVIRQIYTEVQNLDGGSLANLDAAISSRASAAQATAIQADTDDIQTRLPASLNGGRMRSHVEAMDLGVIGAGQFAANAIGAGIIGPNAIGASQLAADTIGASELAADAVAEIADQVWDELIAGHLGAGSTGAALNGAGSAGDPWTTPVPGSYGAGTAGNILGNRLDAAVTTRSSHSAADVWAVGTRTLTSFGTLAADVWAVATRVLTSGANIVLAKGTGVTGFNDLSAAQVNAEVVDALNVDTYPEPGQGAPGATLSLVAKVGYLYKAWRNRTTQTNTQYSLYADNATTLDQKAAFSDNGTIADRAEVGSGP